MCYNIYTFQSKNIKGGLKYMKKIYRFKCDGIGLIIKANIAILSPRRKRKHIIEKHRLVQNSLCGAYSVRELHYRGGTEIVVWAMEWCPSLADVRKMRNTFPRIRVSYTEEELEYFRIMKELEEEKKRLNEIAS